MCCAGPGDEGGGDKLSKKQRKLLNRLKIAELKQQCLRPDVVEVWDVTAQDPQTLVTIKVRSGGRGAGQGPGGGGREGGGEGSAEELKEGGGQVERNA
jgi:hypothetical protein